MASKIEIAEKRYEEMENRRAEFMKQYAESGSTLSLDLANNETESMSKLTIAIMKAKKEEN